MTDSVRAIADAVLYEGYVLWPYRRSAMKNRQRWTFGGVYPPGWTEDRTEVSATVPTTVSDVSVRFLQVVHRQVLFHGQPVDAAGGWATWEEAVERESTGDGGRLTGFSISAGSEREDVGDGVSLVRSWHELRGVVEVDGGTVVIRNETPWAGGDRQEALKHTMCSLHAVLHGSFDDSMDGRSGDGLWPVLIDETTMLASPIILDDHPRVAPESPGDLFDGGEIDELLILNTLALTDAEKAEMRATDPRTREILDRVESLSHDQLMQLHGRTQI
jgi:hypothetical protein